MAKPDPTDKLLDELHRQSDKPHRASLRNNAAAHDAFENDPTT